MVLDAVSCYDRISPPIASLCLQRQGTPPSVISVMFTTLDEMRHYIRTAAGDSDQYYSKSTHNKKLHGILQGNGAGPMIWAMVSTPILERMRKLGFGVPIIHPLTNAAFQVTAFSFVDDSDFPQLLSNSFSPEVDSQKNFNEWLDSLISTGGDVSDDKSNWYAMIHAWANNNWKILSKEACPGDIFKFMPDGTRNRITRLNCSEATKALGIMFAPDGDMTSHVEYLREKAVTWSEQVRCGVLRRSEAWYAMNTSILKSIEYSLTATTMTKQQTETIMRPILKAGLSKSGLSQKFPRTAVYSSLKYQGLGICDPYFTQGVKKLSIFLQSNLSVPLMNHAIQTLWYLTRLECGLGPHFLTKPFPPASCIVTRGWIAYLWEFVSHYNIIVHQHALDVFRFPTDTYIMEAILLRGTNYKQSITAGSFYKLKPFLTS
jgi:hypothetical protein